PYFELFLWSIATLAWRATEPDTWINAVGYMGMTVSGIKSIVNFNPLLKFDGYYLLSDYLGMPNLRRRAFAYIGGWIKRLGGAARSSGMPLPASRLPPRAGDALARGGRRRR